MKAGRLSAGIPLLLFLLLCTALPDVVRGRVWEIQWEWVPSLGLSLRFRLDGLSLLFGLIVTGVGFLVVAYASAYMAGHHQTGRFFGLLHAFLISMLGVVTADNLLLLFVFWEATTVFSYLLIGFNHESDEARESARQAILVTGGGGLALLIGILMLPSAGVSLVPSQWVSAGDPLSGHPLYPAILGAVLIGAFTKSAQFPFHFWLPNAMSAPTPISAFLHAATMVKAGIYILMRFHPLLGGTDLWTGILIGVGGVTAVWGAIQALTPQDLKRMLAYTTMSALGILTMFLGGRNTAALTAAATFLLVHALYKASLFLAVGSIDHETGTRRLDHLGGLYRLMPFTALAVAAATLSMAGFPLFFGFIGKEIMYQGALAEELFPHIAVSTALITNSLMTAVAGVIWLVPFGGKLPPGLRDVHDPEWIMRLGPCLLGIIGIVFGMIPGWVSDHLIEPAVHSFHPTREDIRLALFHGFNVPLLLSVITLTAGGTIFMYRRIIRHGFKFFQKRLPVSFHGLYLTGMEKFLAAAGWVTGRWQHGSLTGYLGVILVVLAAAIWWPWIWYGGSPLRFPEIAGFWSVTGLVALTGGASVVAVRAATKLAAVAALGTVGAGVALIFLIFGAPDIAMTQLLVETLTLVIVSIVMLRLPSLDTGPKRRPAVRILHGILAGSIGLGITFLLMGIIEPPLDRNLTAYYETGSYLLAHGRNIVNVILVDFRSLDTLGEITVVVLASWAVVALIRKPHADTSAEGSE